MVVAQPHAARPEIARLRRTADSRFARGVDVNRLRYLYTILGGALVGIAGRPSRWTSRSAGQTATSAAGRAGSRWQSSSSAAGHPFAARSARCSSARQSPGHGLAARLPGGFGCGLQRIPLDSMILVCWPLAAATYGRSDLSTPCPEAGSACHGASCASRRHGPGDTFPRR